MRKNTDLENDCLFSFALFYLISTIYYKLHRLYYICFLLSRSPLILFSFVCYFPCDLWIQNLRPGSKATLLICRPSSTELEDMLVNLDLNAFLLLHLGLAHEQNSSWTWPEKCGSSINISYYSSTLDILKTSVAVFYFSL